MSGKNGDGAPRAACFDDYFKAQSNIERARKKVGEASL
jgi:hypothetical protein